jgi:hypothetical protein
MHIICGRMLLISSHVRIARAPFSSLEIVALRAPDKSSRRFVMDPPKLMAMTIQLPRLSAVISDDEPVKTLPISLAITVPNPDQSRPIHHPPQIPLDKTEWDSDRLSQTCARAFPQAAHFLIGSSPVVLLVFVEEDGHPSQAQVIQSSGDARRDQSVNDCVLSFGEFDPIFEQGQASASWQRIHWAHRASMAIAQ